MYYIYILYIIIIILYIDIYRMNECFIVSVFYKYIVEKHKNARKIARVHFPTWAVPKCTKGLAKPYDK